MSKKPEKVDFNKLTKGALIAMVKKLIARERKLSDEIERLRTEIAHDAAEVNATPALPNPFVWPWEQTK